MGFDNLLKKIQDLHCWDLPKILIIIMMIRTCSGSFYMVRN